MVQLGTSGSIAYNEKALLSVAALKSTKDEYSTTDNRST